MRPSDRHQRIMDTLRMRERASVSELADIMQASQETIRRDLNALADQGLLEKFHGGASLPPAGDRENAFQTRLHEHASEKQMIARHAASLFRAGDSLFIDTGTTTLMFARALAGKQPMTIITNSLQIAGTLGSTGHRVFTIGGEYHADADENLGTLALDQIRRFNAEHAVITVGALDRDGAMDFSLEEADVARAMVAQASSLTVIADGSKLDRRALFQIFPLARIDRLVVDRAPTPELARALDEAGVELYVAEA
ncbi:DeoR/GlpR family DNA-binding transcription regulator [Salinicola rhizosphaerae]|uniref:DeoR family transcriptional regulator n=1 Tax=Salinicola rhizosphaerae TaxID=1443141 RepID=A0ABQ3DZR6_9GAMM|nr:DeoR/GlpR family DNA-binding transcription regulator [Salinicola rhizosphaerae]GHB21539.1 DeoR family transcriptional regulator [Salinicola rhizosphaerae]